MKVVHLISGGDVGGAKTHVHSLIQYLNKTITADLVCFTDGQFADEARALGINVSIFSTGNPLSALKKLSLYITKNGYDIIHCHGSRANMMGALLKKKLHLPVVTTVHSDYKLDYLGRPLHRLTYGTINSVSLRTLDYHIGVSDAMSEMLISRGFDAETTFSIYNGLDFDISGVIINRNEYFKTLDIDNDTVIFGIVARFDPVKDISTLIRAFAAARSECENIRLAIAGTGSEEQMLKALAAELGIEKDVCFAGWVEEMDKFYAAIDVNTLTSLSETFPYVLTEGARASLPTIASNVGGVPSLIMSGVSGLLFPPGDVDALKDHMLALARDENLRKRMGQKLHDSAKTRYSLGATINKQLEIYDIILRRSERPKKRRDGVMICGAYGKGNTGDDAILEAIISEMREIDPDMPITVLSRTPSLTSVSYRVGSVYTFNFFSFINRMRKTKLYISGGGSLIQDVTSTRSLNYYLVSISIAKMLGNRVQMYGCGVGPVSRPSNRKRAAKVISKRVDVITLRESSSAAELESMGVSGPEIVLSADPALRLKPQSEDVIKSRLAAAGVPADCEYICFSLRPWPVFDEKADVFATAADYAAVRYGLVPVFLPIEPRRDVAAAELVASLMQATSYTLDPPGTGGVAMGLMAKMRLLVSMRLHALVFAAGSGIPLVGAVYDPKVSAFLDYIGQSNYCQLEDLDLETLKKLIDNALSAKRSIQSIEELLQLERKNVEAARRLLESE